MTTVRITPSRVLLAGVAVVGTILYAASFALCDSAHTLAPFAAAVGVSAGVAWIGFGLLIHITCGTRQIHRWIDLCLKTQAIGIAVLMLAALANAMFFASVNRLGSKPIFPVFIVVHAGLLLLADTIMGLHFVSTSVERIAGMTRPRAIAACVLGLNGMFAIILTLLVRSEAHDDRADQRVHPAGVPHAGWESARARAAAAGAGDARRVRVLEHRRLPGRSDAARAPLPAPFRLHLSPRRLSPVRPRTRARRRSD